MIFMWQITGDYPKYQSLLFVSGSILHWSSSPITASYKYGSHGHNCFFHKLPYSLLKYSHKITGHINYFNVYKNSLIKFLSIIRKDKGRNEFYRMVNYSRIMVPKV